MENLNENEKQAQQDTVGVNGQNGQEREARLRNLILNECKETEAYVLSAEGIIDSFIEQIQDIDPSYTEKEIRKMIDKIYEDEYHEMFYEDFLKCLSYKNASVSDYKTVYYDMFKDMAINYTYYYIAYHEDIIQDKNDAIIDLTYDAYTSTASAIGRIVKNVDYLKNTVYNRISRYIDEDMAEERVDELEELIEKLFKEVDIYYDGGLCDWRCNNEKIDYEYYGNDTANVRINTEVTVEYCFDPDIVEEINQKLEELQIDDTFEDIMSDFEYIDYDREWQGDEIWYYDKGNFIQVQLIQEQFNYDFDELIEHVEEITEEEE